MNKLVIKDWIINNENIFGLEPDFDLALSSIQFEISNQLKNEDINSISDYLGAEIDISNKIRYTEDLTIEKVFVEFLDKFSCYLLLRYLQLSLLKQYLDESNKCILTFSKYLEQYNSLLNSFVISNIDTDEQDFINAEQTLCDNIITELNKPVYNKLSFWTDLTDKPCDFKKNLINTIDKRKKFLLQRQQPQNEAAIHENIESLYSKKVKQLKQIWLPQPKLNVEEFIQKGIDKGFWNDDFKILLQKNTSTYGSGKTFLGNIFIAFKGWAISNDLDYKIAGEVFCDVFNIKIKQSTFEKYKLFCSGNSKQIAELKRSFDIKNSSKFDKQKNN